MAILKCKMCGGDLDVAEEINIIECDYCGTKQTVPNADNEKKINLFNRANRLRMASEFDKAAGIYENIIAEFPEEAEAYWGLCLCNYGIEYVDDPATAKKIPTCHRASFESLQKDENFELALEYADVVAQKLYRDEAREIDRIMSEILAVSKNEKPYDVFICYKETDDKGERTVDSVLAYDIYDALTAKGFNVFFARVTLEDKLGRQYEPYIFAALNSAKVMLSIGTKYEYFHAVWVKNEWSRFLKLMAKDKSKVLIPCFKNIDAYDMPDEFKSLQAQDLGKLGAVQDIVRGVEKIIPKTEATITTEKVVVNQSGGPNVEALLKRGNMALEDKEWDKAKDFYNQVLNMDAECAEAYFGLALVDENFGALEDYIDKGNLNNKNYLRAKQFARGNLLELITSAETERFKEEEKRKQERVKLIKLSNLMAVGRSHFALVQSNGTVFDSGSENGLFIPQWKDIIAVSAGDNYTVGVKQDGTVVSRGSNEEGRCDVYDWTDIVSISAGLDYTVGLKADGTVVAAGSNTVERCNVSGWKNIVAVSTGFAHTVGLKSDGTVVATGLIGNGQCNTESWSKIVAVAVGEYHTVGLRSDGTVVAVGSNSEGQCNVSEWTDIIDVSAKGNHTVGLRSDGTVVAVGDNYVGQCDVGEWTDIVAISTGSIETIGLKADGSVVTTEVAHRDIFNYLELRLFNDFADFEEEYKNRIEEMKRIYEESREEREMARRFAEEKKQQEDEKKRRQQEEYRSKGLCQHCGGTFKGMFTKKCTSCGKEKDY